MPSFFEEVKKRGIVMAYFRVCDKCGSNLDPGERCTCNSKRERLARKYELLVSSNKNNQLRFNFDTKK